MIRKTLPVMMMLSGCGIDSMAGDWDGGLSCYDGAEARLEIVPDAERCVACQQAASGGRRH